MIKRAPILVAVFAILVVASFPVAPANDDTLLTESYPYLLNDLVLGVSAAPCDDAGVGGVRFCEAVAGNISADGPYHVYINIREDFGAAVPGYWLFIREDGSSIPANQGGQGYFCDSINRFVHPEAAELLVFATPVDLDGLLPCGSVGVMGQVTVVWRYEGPIPGIHF